MLTIHLRKVGGSVMLAVPPASLEILHLRPGNEVGVTIEHGCMIVHPRERHHFTLDELLLECKSDSTPIREDRDWLAAEPVGNELI